MWFSNRLNKHESVFNIVLYVCLLNSLKINQSLLHYCKFSQWVVASQDYRLQLVVAFLTRWSSTIRFYVTVGVILSPLSPCSTVVSCCYTPDPLTFSCKGSHILQTLWSAPRTTDEASRRLDHLWVFISRGRNWIVRVMLVGPSKTWEEPGRHLLAIASAINALVTAIAVAEQNVRTF